MGGWVVGWVECEVYYNGTMFVGARELLDTRVDDGGLRRNEVVVGGGVTRMANPRLRYRRSKKVEDGHLCMEAAKGDGVKGVGLCVVPSGRIR